MDDHKLTVKAYKNQDFLNSPDGRSIRILAEFLEPKARFDKNNIIDTIVLFGSARLLSKSDAQKLYEQVKLLDPKEVPNYAQKLRHAQVMLEMSRYYEDAVELSRLLTEWSLNLPTEKNRFIVCSGGGPGIMEAANKGANLAGGLSVGLNISIPFEQFINTYVTPELKFEFHYFFMRKFWFVYLAKSLIVFPGGFGTMDEFFEVLTLLQTGKIKKQMKVIVYDEKYWKKVINFDALIDFGTINPEDMELFSFCNTPMQAFNEITEHFERNYLNKTSSKKSITL
ncbi:MAG: LOG family protein [Clostridiales bacterium]